MRCHREKYTKKHFTGKNRKAEEVRCGATITCDNKGNLILRDYLKRILNQVNFTDKNVLSLGVGCREGLIYAAESGAEKCIGVDFSKHAINIAQEELIKRKIKNTELITDDVLVFLKNYDRKENFDIVIMFDFIESKPRSELRKILQELKKILNKKSIVIINIPEYKHDNDTSQDGFDEGGPINYPSKLGVHRSTRELHHNKYTIISLQDFMKSLGYINVVEAHFFVLGIDLANLLTISYYLRWKMLVDRGYPLLKKYLDNMSEYTCSNTPIKRWVKFDRGDLRGLSIFATESYVSSVYSNGMYDSEIFTDQDFKLNQKKNPIIFDVGGFVGVDSMIFASKISESGKVISFEPNPYNRNRFLKNISMNRENIQNKIRIFPFALSNIAGKVWMNMSTFVDEGGSSTSRIKGSHSKIRNNQLPKGFFKDKVDALTLDDFVKDTHLIPNIIKIDVEGSEHLMLNGALDTLRKFHPTLFIEIHSEYCALVCSRILISLSYDLFVLNEEEDGRIMIKATFRKNKKIETLSMSAKLENNYNILEEINLKLRSTLNKKSKKISNLVKERSHLIEAHSNCELEIKHLQKINDQLTERLGSIVQSRLIRYANLLRRAMNKKIIE